MTAIRMTDEEFMNHPKVQETMLWTKVFALVIAACILWNLVSPLF